MRYCNTLLKRYLSLHVPEEDLIQAITLKTCEVEEWSVRKLPDQVVIGKITAIGRHPQADKLFVCQVDCGHAGKYQICTGGENAIDQAYVPVAIPGCHLPAINLTIGPRVMRGLESNGMICSKHELGISEDTEQHRIWIMQYPTGYAPTSEEQLPDMTDITDADLGMPVKEKYPWLENRIITIENKTITHRPDLFGHFGLARELNALFGKQVRFQQLDQLQDQFDTHHCLTVLEHAQRSPQTISVTSPHVRTYALIDIQTIAVQRSDLYIRTLLYDLGLTPKNNWVDFSNIFMYLTGQPIHCFDAQTIQGTIQVRQAKAGETFIDLLHKTHTLTADDIVIADDAGVIALAGIIGGERTAVQDSTTALIIEIANFDPVVVRRTGTRLGLRTDAELRFEKSINPLFSLAMVPYLMETSTYGDQTKNATFAGINRWALPEATQQMPQIHYDTNRIAQLLYGNDVPHTFATDAASILQALGFTVGDDRVRAPLWRSPNDCLHTQDILEEIARVTGYDALIAQPYHDAVTWKPSDSLVSLVKRAEQFCEHTGHAQQLETYPRIHNDVVTTLSLPTDHLYTMANSLRTEWQFLRDTLLRNLLDYVQKNHYQHPTGNIFDCGQTRDNTKMPVETTHIATVSRSNFPVAPSPEHPFLQMKGQLLMLLNSLGIEHLAYTQTNISRAHPTQQATFSYENTPLATLVTIHPAILLRLWGQEHLCQGPVVAREIDLTAVNHMLQQKTAAAHHAYATLQDQRVTKDISFTVDFQNNLSVLTNQLRTALPAISDISLFDLYAGERIPTGKKSISLRLTIVGDGTWTSEQFNSVLQESLTIAQQHGAEIRG